MHLADRELRIEGDCSILTKALERSKTLPDGNLAVAREHAGLIDDFEPFLRSVGADRLPGIHEPVRADLYAFGAMTFALADRDVPPPFMEDRTRDPAFNDYAVHVVRQAMTEGGRVLVLVPSFADVEAMAHRIPDVIAHRRGEKLAAHLDTLKASRNGVLATPAA